MNTLNESRVARRDLLKGALAASVASLGVMGRNTRAVAPDPAGPNTNLIERENRKTGSTDWQLTAVRLNRAMGAVVPWIEGYCSQQSVAAGETLEIMVSTDPPAKFTIEIFRMGYYGGRGARLMTTLGPFSGKAQPLPPVGPRRLRECRWEPAAELTIPADWPSGVYLGRLSHASRTTTGSTPGRATSSSSCATTGRPTSSSSAPTTPGRPTTAGPTTSRSTTTGITTDWSMPADVDVSFDRPYGKYRQIYENPQSVGSGEFLCWEFPLAYWLEQHGYDVTYCSNSDMLTPERTAEVQGLPQRRPRRVLGPAAVRERQGACSTRA